MTKEVTQPDSSNDADSTSTAPSPESMMTESASPWQFSLRGLMLLMTIGAIASAIAAARGAGSLVLSLGVALTAFNSAGFLRRWQTPQSRPRWVYLGWLVFLTSMFLPAAKGCGNSESAGWELAWGCAALEVDALIKVSTLEDERKQVAEQLAKEPAKVVMPHYFLLTITLANVIMLLAPMTLVAWHRKRGRWLQGLLLLGATTGWSITWNSEQNGPLFGYYVWCLGMTLVLTSQRLPWRYTIACGCQLVAWFLTGGLN